MKSPARWRYAITREQLGFAGPLGHRAKCRDRATAPYEDIPDLGICTFVSKIGWFWALPYRELTGEYPKGDCDLIRNIVTPSVGGFRGGRLSRLCSDVVGWFTGELRPPK
jgi:hypothetical protein